jgi:hypothetical protein
MAGTVKSMNRDERIRARAHRLWEEEGRPSGRHNEHWQRACDEIDAEMRNSGGRTGIPQVSPSGDRGTQQSDSSLAGAGDTTVAGPGLMGVDDAKASGRQSEPNANQPSTGRSKLAGS